MSRQSTGRRHVRRWLWALAVLPAFGALPAVPALGHVVASPRQAQAGSQADVTFLVDHGCYGTGTTALTVQLPSGASGAEPWPVAGFQTAVDSAARQVRWSGGSLSDTATHAFTLRLTLPATPGQVLHFPVTQTCQQGAIEWTQPLAAGQDPDDLDTPAPAVRLTAEAPASAQARVDATQASQQAAGAPIGGVAAGAGGAAGDSRLWIRTLLGLLLPAGAALGGWLLRDS